LLCEIQRTKGFEGISIEKYQITANSDLKVFDLVSVGPKGKFHKSVVFAKTSYEGVFSLNLADFDHNSGYLDYSFL
jgi:hypothetical protein